MNDFLTIRMSSRLYVNFYAVTCTFRLHIGLLAKFDFPVRMTNKNLFNYQSNLSEKLMIKGVFDWLF